MKNKKKVTKVPKVGELKKWTLNICFPNYRCVEVEAKTRDEAWRVAMLSDNHPEWEDSKYGAVQFVEETKNVRR